MGRRMGGECSLKRAEIDVSHRSSLVTVASMLGFAGAFGCHGRASPDDCAQMVDRYLDLAAKEAPGGPKMTPAQTAAVRDVERGLKRAEPTYRRVEDRCESVDRSEARCALGADTTAAWEACLRGSRPPERD